MFKLGFANIVIRIVTLLSKFLVVIIIANDISPSDLGIYGIINVTIGLGIYLLGLDFYVFNSREILNKKSELRLNLIRDQFVFHMIIYILFLPLFMLLFLFNIVDWQYITVFYFILVTEHIGTELSRILLTISSSIHANLIIFFKNGLWVLILIIIKYYNVDLSLSSILNLWFFGCITGIAWGVLILYKKIIANKIYRLKPIDWKWIIKGVHNSSKLLLSTIALLAIDLLTRYFLKVSAGNKVVGVFTFFMNISNMLQVFIYTGLISILQPKLITAHFNKDQLLYIKLLTNLKRNMFILLLVLVPMAMLGIFILFIFLKDDIYKENVPVYYLLLISVSLNVISQIYYIELYVNRIDKFIVISSITAFIVCVIFNLILTPRLYLLGAGLSMTCSMLSLLLLRFFFVKKYLRRKYENRLYSTL